MSTSETGISCELSRHTESDTETFEKIRQGTPKPQICMQTFMYAYISKNNHLKAKKQSSKYHTTHTNKGN